MTGGHWDFVWAAYGVAAVVLTGLVVKIWVDMRRQKATLDDLEARGVARRGPSSANPAGEAGSAVGVRS